MIPIVALALERSYLAANRQVGRHQVASLAVAGQKYRRYASSKVETGKMKGRI